MRGFWADERVDGKIWKKEKFPFNKIYNYFKKKELQFFSEADHTVSLTFNGKNEIHSWKSISKILRIFGGMSGKTSLIL